MGNDYAIASVPRYRIEHLLTPHGERLPEREYLAAIAPGGS